ncbi:hypothetical protein GWP49_34480, partial [Klebsiella pneumoniae]|nr:hypothetical protein [Klebsiella pneumoniae]
NVKNADIVIDTGSSAEVLKAAIDALNQIGAIGSIIHKRNKQKIEYVTVVEGRKGTLAITTGFASGYTGTGTTEFQKFLKHVGVDQKEIDSLTTDTDNEKVLRFTIK